MLASPARGDSITVSYTGMITFAQAAGIAVGDTFTGSVTYLTTSPQVASASGVSPTDTYGLQDSVDSLLFTVDGFSFDVRGNRSLALNVQAPDPVYGYWSFNVQDENPGPAFTTNYALNGQAFLGSEVQFEGNSDLFKSLALPTTFSTANIIYGDNGPNGPGSYPTCAIVQLSGGFAGGTITTVTVTQVAPEPASLRLIGIGLLAAGALARRRRRAGHLDVARAD